MPYHVSIEPIGDRQARLEQAAATDHKERIVFRAVNLDLDVKRVPSSCLLYRTANIRTIVRQREIVSKRHLDAAFFIAGEENNETQQAQHEILVEMAHDPTADIYSSLVTSRQQRDPLLITVRGVVVNGNRRLAAMRELHYSNPETFSSFTHIEVAVLPPDANEDDLSEIETRLQIAPDLRSAYGWVEEALGLEKQIGGGWTLERAATVWGVPTAELEKRLTHLRLAEQYLEFIDKPSDYKRVADDKQAIETFSTSQRIRSTGGTPVTQLDAERLVMFAVLANDVADRKYNYAKDIEEVTREVIIQIDDVPEVAPVSTESDPLDPLSGLPLQVGGVSAEVLHILRDRSLSSEIAQKAESVLADIKSSRSAARRGRQLLEAVKGALSKISGLTLTDSDEGTYAKALVQLISLQCEASRLMRLLLTDKPSLAREIDLAMRNPLREVTATINTLNNLAD